MQIPKLFIESNIRLGTVVVDSTSDRPSMRILGTLGKNWNDDITFSKSPSVKLSGEQEEAICWLIDDVNNTGVDYD